METKNELLEFVKQNMDVIRDLKSNYLSEYCFEGECHLSVDDMINQTDVMDDPEEYGFSKIDYHSCYVSDGYTYEVFRDDWNEIQPNIIMVGDELDTMFITDQDLPMYLGNTITYSSEIFFGSVMNNNKSLQPFEVNGKTLYISFIIPDPGSN